jgi:uncharacterized protein YeaO (DUF488 family)
MSERTVDVRIKRVYDPSAADDGYRVFVDRLWPRGMKKEDLSYDVWAKKLAPSPEARKEFGHDPARFPAFRGRYLQELDANEEAAAFVQNLIDQHAPTVTLLYAARDRTCNHALVLQEWLKNRLA